MNKPVDTRLSQKEWRLLLEQANRLSDEGTTGPEIAKLLGVSYTSLLNHGYSAKNTARENIDRGYRYRDGYEEDILRRAKEIYDEEIEKGKGFGKDFSLASIIRRIRTEYENGEEPCPSESRCYQLFQKVGFPLKTEFPKSEASPSATPRPAHAQEPSPPNASPSTKSRRPREEKGYRPHHALGNAMEMLEEMIDAIAAAGDRSFDSLSEQVQSLKEAEKDLVAKGQDIDRRARELRKAKAKHRNDTRQFYRGIKQLKSQIKRRKIGGGD